MRPPGRLRLRKDLQNLGYLPQVEPLAVLSTRLDGDHAGSAMDRHASNAITADSGHICSVCKEHGVHPPSAVACKQVLQDPLSLLHALAAFKVRLVFRVLTEDPGPRFCRSFPRFAS